MGLLWFPGLKSGFGVPGFGRCSGLATGLSGAGLSEDGLFTLPVGGFGFSDGLADGGVPDGRSVVTFPEGLLPDGLPVEGFLSAGLISGFGRPALSGLVTAEALFPEGRCADCLSCDGLADTVLLSEDLLEGLLTWVERDEEDGRETEPED